MDRAFSITGSGTVVTGTLPAGTVSRGDELAVTPAMRPVRVRALQSLGENAAELTGVARAALNLRGVDRAEVRRGHGADPARPVDAGQAGRRPGQRRRTTRGRQQPGDLLPAQITVHVGSARTPARSGCSATRPARLTLRDPLPLHVARPGAAARSRFCRGTRPQMGDLRTWRALSARWCSTRSAAADPPRRGRRRGRRARVLAGSTRRRRPAQAARAGGRRRPRRDGRDRAAGAGRGRLARRSADTGRAWPSGWPRSSPSTPSATRSPPACRSRPRGRHCGCPTGGSCSRWRRRRRRSTLAGGLLTASGQRRRAAAAR